MIKTSPSATAEKRPSAQSLSPLSWHCCITRLVIRSAARTPGDSDSVTTLVVKHSKTAQEDVPKKESREFAQQESCQNDPSVPRPNYHSRTIPKKTLSKKRCLGKHLKTKKVHVESRRHTGSKKIPADQTAQKQLTKPSSRQVPTFSKTPSNHRP